jgi:phosphoglycolate phosphatase-like HAD superfamily hydrolase
VLVLWDIDGTLLDAAGFGRRALHEAFQAAFSQPAPAGIPFAGRTDLAIITAHLRGQGARAAKDVEAFIARFAATAWEQRGTLLGHGGHHLPGAHDTLRRFAAMPHIAQSVLTGNIPAVAGIKLALRS